MTISQCIDRTFGLAVGLACLVAVAPTTAAEEEKAHAEHAAVVEVVSTNVQGKNVFIPSTIVVGAGMPHTLSIYNTTDVPHGFAIDGLGIEFVLPPKEEFKVELPALVGDKIYVVRCQLHPPHRSARLVVLDAD
jgi:heme/copper-type cytochrome/quinol oxidase subunit 2